LLLLTATFFQVLLVLGISTFLRESMGMDLPWQHVTVFLTSTVFFLGAGFFAAGLITGPRMWIIPAGLLAIFLGFSWKDEYTVHSWNLVMNTSGALASVALIVYAVGLFVASIPGGDGRSV